jgi:hypothetical protein
MDGFPEMLVVAQDGFPGFLHFVINPFRDSKLRRIEMFAKEDETKLRVQTNYKLIEMGCYRNRFQTHL